MNTDWKRRYLIIWNNSSTSSIYPLTKHAEQKLSPEVLSYFIQIFTHLKLCLATATHNLWLDIFNRPIKRIASEYGRA